MQKINNSSKRIISGFLSLVMVLGIAFGIPTTVSADTIASTDSTASITATTSAMCIPGSNYLGEFTFTGKNIGANRAIMGRKMRFRVAHKAVDNQYVYGMYLTCYRWDGVKMLENFCIGNTETDADGYRYFVSDWFDVSYGVDYHLEYSASTFGTGSDPRRINCRVWFDVQ